MIDERARDVAKRREVEVGLGLDANRFDRPHVGGALAGEVEQCGLPDSGFAGDQQGAAPSRPNIVQKSVDLLHFSAPPQKHAVSLTHGGRSPCALELGHSLVLLPPGPV